MIQNGAYDKIEGFLFEGKNQDYGAFVMRRKLQKQSFIGTVIGMGILTLVYLSPLLLRLSREEMIVDMRQVPAEVTPYSELIAPPPIPEAPEPIQAVQEPPEVATKRFVKPELRPDDQVQDEELIPTIAELKDANPGLKTKEGTGDIHAHYIPDVVIIEEIKIAPPPPPPPPPPKEEIFSYVEKWPEFPGGEIEMQKFIANNIVYPRTALETGIEGTVVIQFVVDRSGVIKEIAIVRDIGGGCGDEAVRIVNQMPKWIPGEQNGVPVAVRYTLPVRFRLLQ